MNSEEFINTFSKFLNESNTMAAIDIASKPENSDCISSCLSDLLPVVLSFLNEDTRNDSPDLFDNCEQLLFIFGENIQPEEYLLELIEQIEIANNDTLFCVLLSLLQKLLFKFSDRRSLNWCLIAIKRYICRDSSSSRYNFENEDNFISITEQINNLHNVVIDFIRPFVNEVKLGSTLSKKEKNTRNVIICFLLQIMEKPFAILDFKLNLNTNNISRVTAKKLMDLLSHIVSDKLSFLEFSSRRQKEDTDPLADIGDEKFAFEIEEIPILAYSIFYYLLFSEEIGIENIPFVYDPIYILQTCLPFATYLLCETDERLLRKGLKLSSALMCIMPSDTSHIVLDLDVHRNFTIALINIMIYNSIHEDRQSALAIFNRYFSNFNVKAQYLIIYHMRDVSNHAGILGLLILKYKDIVLKMLNKNNVSEYAKGSNLKLILLKYASLTKEITQNLLSMTDLISSVLNFLQFLLIRDKENITNIWAYADDIKITFLIPLQDSISSSEEYYRIKQKSILNNETPCEKSAEKFSIQTVNGDILEALPPEKQLEVIDCSLNGLQIMKDFVLRVLEIIKK